MLVSLAPNGAFLCNKDSFRIELYFNARQLLAGAVEFSRFYLSAGTLAFFVFFLLDEHFLLAACLAVAASLAPVGASC